MQHTDDFGLAGSHGSAVAQFEWFKKDGLEELFAEISPIVSFNKNLVYWMITSISASRNIRKTSAASATLPMLPLRVNAAPVNRDTGEISEQEVFMGDFPLHDGRGYIHH